MAFALPVVCLFAATAFAGPVTAPDAACDSLPDRPIAALESIGTTFVMGFETPRLPAGERLGLLGATVLFDAGSAWRFGPAVYGAASGHRGGFFVGGVEAQRLWRPAPGWSLATGLFAGGGGGAAAPVGSGLMLRPAVTLLRDIAPSLQAGVSLSAVRFPSGEIGSRQLGLVLAWRDDFAYFDSRAGNSTPPLPRATGLGFDSIAATAAIYRIDGGIANGNANGGGNGGANSNDIGTGTRRIGLAGARASRRIGEHLAWGLQAAAAAQGDAAGYLEILGDVTLDAAPLASARPEWRIGVRAVAGLGGGGTVPTGGGTVAKATAVTSLRLARGWTLGAEYGRVRSAGGSLRARELQVSLAIDLESHLTGHGGGGGGLGGGSDGGGHGGDGGRRGAGFNVGRAGHVVRTEWVAAWQRDTRIARRDGTRASIDTIGLKLNRYVGDNLYVSGQAHSAFAGGAGAYSIGLVGAGLSTDPAAPWRLGAEALVGAAGGGGVETAGGALAQGLAWVGWQPLDGGEWRAGLGALRTRRGGGASPVIEFSWSRAFGMAGR